MHTKTVAIVMTIAKVSCAVVSCATALMLVHIIPDLLSVKTREIFLKNKAEELDREMGLILTQEETGRHVRMLTHEIRSTLDRHTILKTTLVELGRTLGLGECALWMPCRSGDLQLSHTLNYDAQIGSTVPFSLPIVNEVFKSSRAMRIPYTCPLAQIRPLVGRYMQPEIVALRVPLLNHSNFQMNDWPEVYAIMVLILPTDSTRKWRDHELELVDVVADQVAVALSHATIVEESMRASDQLVEQNVDLDLAWREAELAIRARNDFLAVLNHEMRTPMHAIIALSSLLLETELTPDHRVMIESAIDLIKPIATVKKLSMTLILAPDVPVCAVGDENRLMQTILNVAESSRDWRPPEFYPAPSNGHFYLRVQVKDSGSGILPQDIPRIFTKFTQPRNGSNRVNDGAGLGLAICKRFVNTMGGHIWIESEGIDKGTLVFIVKLAICDSCSSTIAHQTVPKGEANHGSADIIGYKPAFRVGYGLASTNARYQRSL
ncbi:hypothetical protein ACLB2K_014355 [Fragaria x ananassa]